MVQSASIRDFKARLARYLRLVEAGDSVAVTRHGRPVALVVRPAPGTDCKVPEAEWWRGALAEGVLVPAEGRGRKVRPERGLAKHGRSAALRFVRERRS